MAETTATVVHVDALNRVSRQAHKRAADLELQLAEILRPLLKAAGERAAKKFMETATDHLTAAVGPAMPAPRWSAPAPDEVLDVHSLSASIRTKTDPVRVAMVQTVMSATLTKAGLNFDASNPFTRRVLEQTGSQIVDISQTTQHNVMRIIRTSYDEGLSIPDTAKAIRVGMEEASVARSKVIARTEMVGAVNGGSLAATQIIASATGTAYNKVWMTAPGAKHPRHANYPGLDGQSVGLDDTFDVGGFDLLFPGDPNGPPEEVVMCRCALEYADPADSIVRISEGYDILPDDVSVGAGAPVPPAYVARVKELGLDQWPPPLDAAAARILKGAPSTEDAFLKKTLMESGESIDSWDAQRARIHEDIIEAFFRDKVPSGKKDAFFTAGGSASGKSAARFTRDGKEYSLDDLVGYKDKQGVWHPGLSDVIHIDADTVKGMLPEYKALVEEGSQYAAYAVHEESSYLTKMIAKRAYDDGYSLVLDGTASSGKFIGKIDEAIASGYKVKVTMVSARTNVAIARSIDRGDKKGRYVALSALKDAHAGASKQLAKWVDHKGIDEWRVYENSSPTFDSKLIATGGRGQKTIIDESDWDAVIAKTDEVDQPVSGSDAIRPTGSPVEASSDIPGGGRVVPGGGPGGDIPGAICNVTAAGRKSSCAIDAPDMRLATMEERKAAGIPPAWLDVHKAVHPDQKIQFAGRAPNGKLTYKYAAWWDEERAALKFARLKAFNAKLDELLPVFSKDAGLGDDDASALSLIYKTGFRVGSNTDTHAKKKAYGSTTMRAEHVKIKGDEVSFSFIGKKGVLIEKTIVDRELALMLKPRVKAGGALFDTTDVKVRKYLAEIDGGFTPKDFRTWTGTGRAIEEIAKMKPPKNAAEFAIAQKKVARAVADELGNTPAVALDAYIDPAVFASWEAGIALRMKEYAADLAKDAALRAKGIITPRMLAEQLVGRAAGEEKAVTSALKAAVKKQDGKMVDLDYRIKDVDSLARKITSEIEESPSLTVQQAAGAMNDVLRYTAQLSEDKYAEGAQAILDSLAKRGYTPIKSKNYWAEGNDYKGYHVILEGLGGKVELQFHTERGLAVKDVNHELYDISRVSKDAKERYQIWQESVANSAKIPEPPSTSLFGPPTPKVPDKEVQKLMTKDEKKLLGLAAAASVDVPEEEPKTRAQWMNQFLSGIVYDAEPSAAEAEAWDVPFNDD